jgi:hypothetical protein
MTEFPFIIRWRNAVLSENGPKQFLTRYVLLVLGTYMNHEGDSCYPSIEALAKRCGFKSKHTVIKNIRLAIHEGWLKREKKRVAYGKNWRRSSYVATLPKRLEKNLIQPADILNGNCEGGAYHAPPEADEVEGGAYHVQGGARHAPPGAGGGAYHAPEVVHAVHPSSSINRSKKENSSTRTTPGGNGFERPVPPACPKRREKIAIRGPKTAEELQADKEAMLRIFGTPAQ